MKENCLFPLVTFHVGTYYYQNPDIHDRNRRYAVDRISGRKTRRLDLGRGRTMVRRLRREPPQAGTALPRFLHGRTPVGRSRGRSQSLLADAASAHRGAQAPRTDETAAHRRPLCGRLRRRTPHRRFAAVSLPVCGRPHLYGHDRRAGLLDPSLRRFERTTDAPLAAALRIRFRQRGPHGASDGGSFLRHPQNGRRTVYR